jgi:hypothetical protein
MGERKERVPFSYEEKERVKKGRVGGGKRAKG